MKVIFPPSEIIHAHVHRYGNGTAIVVNIAYITSELDLNFI